MGRKWPRQPGNQNEVRRPRTCRRFLSSSRGGIAIVTLNRPEKRNALSPEMVVAAHAVLEGSRGRSLRCASIVRHRRRRPGLLGRRRHGQPDPADDAHARAGGRMGRALLGRPQATRRGHSAQRELLQACDRSHQRPRACGRRRSSCSHRSARDVEHRDTRGHRSAPRLDRKRRVAGAAGAASVVGACDGAAAAGRAGVRGEGADDGTRQSRRAARSGAGNGAWIWRAHEPWRAGGAREDQGRRSCARTAGRSKRRSRSRPNAPSRTLRWRTPRKARAHSWKSVRRCFAGGPTK